ncbi:MAG TPA: LysM peptidoglycan-binding domain-containing protein [Anaerolineales bacterium]|nr:LysM peptidoglycan-binding domain-containing protein [Anaerolineales bacterium]
MLNRTPPKSSDVIQSYRKRRLQRGPLLMYGSIALVVLGIILLLVWLTRPNQPLGGLFATDTPTPTLTSTPTSTPPPTETPTITPTPTITVSPTPSEAFDYTIQEGDSLDALAQRFNLGPDGILLIYNENRDVMEANNGVIFVGQTIRIPPPGSILPTFTPIPGNLPRGTLIEYSVLPGDTLAGIAVRFNSIAEEIIAENEIENANALQVGDVLQIPVNLITPTPTLPSTSTPVTPTVAGGTPTPSQAPAGAGSTPAAACDFDENASFVTQLQTLINDERTSNNLSELSTNAQLAAAAEAHAIDLLCNNYLSHEGSDGSTPESRVEAQGFDASLVVEEIYAAPINVGDPQAAIDWWLRDPASRESLLNPDTTVFGVAYVSSEDSMLGSYFVVVSAAP